MAFLPPPVMIAILGARQTGQRSGQGCRRETAAQN
jgi:hypothetical protein